MEDEPRTVMIFPVKAIASLRARAAGAVLLPDEGLEGWSRSNADPAKIVHVFHTLQRSIGATTLHNGRLFKVKRNGAGAHKDVSAAPPVNVREMKLSNWCGSDWGYNAAIRAM